MNAQQQINSSNVTRNLKAQTSNVDCLADTITMQAWMPATTPANKKAYGLSHARSTQRFNKKDLLEAAKIAETDVFQTANNLRPDSAALQLVALTVDLDVMEKGLDRLDRQDRYEKHIQKAFSNFDVDASNGYGFHALCGFLAEGRNNFDAPVSFEYETALLDLIPRATIADRPVVTTRVRTFTAPRQPRQDLCRLF